MIFIMHSYLFILPKDSASITYLYFCVFVWPIWNYGSLLVSVFYEVIWCQCFALTGWSSIWCASFGITTCQARYFPWTKAVRRGLPEEMDWGILMSCPFRFLHWVASHFSKLTQLKLYFRVYLNHTSGYALWLTMFRMVIKGRHFWRFLSGIMFHC